jgi:hypothetical protein
MIVIDQRATPVGRCVSVPLSARKFGDTNVLAILAVSSFRSSGDLSMIQKKLQVIRGER